MDLVKLITQKVEEIAESGKLAEIVEKHATEAIDDIVKYSFRWSGEAKKSIEKALKDKLAIKAENLSLDNYQKIMSDLVAERVNNTNIENLKNQLNEAVDSVTKPIEKRSWKLSEIIEKFIDLEIDKSIDGDMEEDSGECTLSVSKSSGSFYHVYFSKEEDKEYYHCENEIGIHEGRLFTATIDNLPYSPFNTSIMSPFQKFIFQLYCNNVEIINDEEKCDLIYYRDDYE